jgi:hypothetical protein
MPPRPPGSVYSGTVFEAVASNSPCRSRRLRGVATTSFVRIANPVWIEQSPFLHRTLGRGDRRFLPRTLDSCAIRLPTQRIETFTTMPLIADRLDPKDVATRIQNGNNRACLGPAVAKGTTPNFWGGRVSSLSFINLTGLAAPYAPDIHTRAYSVPGSGVNSGGRQALRERT